MIGVFDSGSGGLTVLKAIRERVPYADIVYFGDIKHVPYGTKTNKELSLLTVSAIELLQKRGAESIVSACNSVSATLAISLFDSLSLAPNSLIEMVGPTVSHFKQTEERVLLVATPATINSEIYQNAFHMIGKEITALAIPDLAKAIEFDEPCEKVEAIIRGALSAVSIREFDILILACTHYPLVTNLFQKVVGDDIQIFDPAYAVAERVERQLASREQGGGSLRFIISADSMAFRARVDELFSQGDFQIEVVE